MNTSHKFVPLLAALALLPAGASKAADVSVDVFYDNLDPYGDWVEVGDYGYCWHPRDAGADWRPYNDGNWVYTDAGWTWMSDEPYGWAVYHYGRWTRAERVGWVWVPDTEWAPAWVSWRHSDRYVGWAPLPPESRTRVGVAIGESVDVEFDIGPAFYSFVDVRNLGAPRLRSVVLPPRENITIINQTTNITNITYQNNVVINNGPDYNVVSRQSSQPIRRLKLQRRAEIADLRTARAEQLGAKVEGESLVVAAPALQKTADAKPKKLGQRVEKTAIDRGWKDAGDPKQVETARAKMKEQAKDARTGNVAEKAPGTPASASSEQPGAPGADPAGQPGAPEARPGTQSKRESVATAPEQTPRDEQKPGKGKARDRKNAVAESAGDPSAPSQVATPDQPNVTREAGQPPRKGQQRGPNAERRANLPEPVAESQEAPADRQSGTRPGRPERPDRPQRDARPNQPPQPENEVRPERNAAPEQPKAPDRPERPEPPSQRDIADKVDRSVRERSVGGEAREAQGQRPERPEKPQAAQPRKPQPPQGRAPGEGKPREGEGDRPKKGEREQ